MKKLLILFLLFFTQIPIFSFQLPEKLEGLWEGKDRYVFLESTRDENKNPYSASQLEIVIVLKEYYGWYYDRAAESEAYSQSENRVRSAATHKDAEHIKIIKVDSLINPSENPDFEVPEDCAWELKFNFSKYEQNRIPVCVIDENMYIDFAMELEYSVTRI